MLVTSVTTLDADATAFVPALWAVDPGGQRPARRLTRGAKGERPLAFLPDGALLFTRRDPDAEADDAPAALWLLPAGSGEARVVGVREGGVQGAVVAADDGRVVVTGATLPGSVTPQDDDRRRKAAPRRRSRRSCTRATRSGTGTPTSAPTSRAC